MLLSYFVTIISLNMDCLLFKIQTLIKSHHAKCPHEIRVCNKLVWNINMQINIYNYKKKKEEEK